MDAAGAWGDIQQAHVPSGANHAVCVAQGNQVGRPGVPFPVFSSVKTAACLAPLWGHFERTDLSADYIDWATWSRAYVNRAIHSSRVRVGDGFIERLSREQLEALHLAVGSQVVRSLVLLRLCRIWLTECTRYRETVCRENIVLSSRSDLRLRSVHCVSTRDSVL